MSPSTNRDSSVPRDRGRDAYLRHQHSASSDHGSRSLVPMWDSSDPERAPPPLPLNPQSPSLTSRAGTSSAIQSAHAALRERAQESALVPSLAKRVNETSPERALVKGAGHRRMQSMVPGSVRDLSLNLQGLNAQSQQNTSPLRSPDRQPATPVSFADNKAPYDRDEDSPGPGPSLTPIVRPTALRRPPAQSILGENTPPQSSTMLALQTMGSNNNVTREAEPPLVDITNGSSSSNAAKEFQNVDQLSAQILSLTKIATSLQKEMSQLSRRSRDNATDLLSLKEATSTRDEDIRRNLRDLLGHVTESSQRLSLASSNFLLDNKPHNPETGGTRAIQLPRIPSPKSFSESFDRASDSTPSLTGAADAPGSVILLQKIIRDMGTKEGQDSLLNRLGEVADKLSGMATASKVEDLARDVKAQSQSQVDLVASNLRPGSSDGLELASSRAGPMTSRVEQLLAKSGRKTSNPSSVRGAELLNDDLIKIIRSVKDSVAQGGGLTAEVKALVRELRGEVLGMGRELGRRLEQVTKDSVEDPEGPKRDEVSRVIDQGLEQMKDQLSHVLREHRRQSAQSASSQKSLVDYQEIYNAMRAALRDNEASEPRDVPALSREDVVEAVRNAWEDYKPEIEIQQIGLERDEVLACLKEGLQDYAAKDEPPSGATRDEILRAVGEGLQHFAPPQMDSPASLSRDEIIEAVRDCLEEFEFPVAASAIGNDFSRADMIDAVKEGLQDLDVPKTRALVPDEDNTDLVSRLHEIMECMRLEFKAVSDEAKENVAANGRDTEQVLDATKDGLENLRLAIEGYVDRATGAAGQEDFMHGLLKTMEDFKEDVTELVSGAQETSRQQLQNELESLRDVVNSSMVPAVAASNIGPDNKEVLESLQNGLTSLRQEILRPRPETGEIMDALNDGLNELRAGLDRVSNKPVDLTANDEILDALKAGLDSVRSDIDGLRDSSVEKAVAAVGDQDDSRHAMIPADAVKQDDIKNLEVLITQLRIKVEAMEPDSSHSTADSIQREDLARLEEMMSHVQQGVEEMASREPSSTARAVPREGEEDVDGGSDATLRDDVQAIETILRNTKARIDDMIDGDQTVRKEHLDGVETLVLDARETLAAMSENMDSLTRKDDIATLESLVLKVSDGFEEMKDRAEKEEESGEKVCKTDLEAVETVVLEIKTALDGFTGTDFSTISNKEDMANMETLIKELQSKLEGHLEASGDALAQRDEKMSGVGERVDEVKTFLTEFQEAVHTKLGDGMAGVESLTKMLEGMGEKIDQNETVGADLKEMFDGMKSEFEETRDIFTGAKLETDEKLQQTTDTISLHIDDKIGEIMAKYEEYQAMLDEKTKAGEARNEETEAAVVGTKAVAEELKLLIDTLGSTVTESLEKMEEASRTVFEKVEELGARSEETQSDHRTEHQNTREQVQQTLSAVEGMHGELAEHQPKILEAIKDVLLLVGEHYEHSKSSATDIQDKLVDAKPLEQAMAMLPAPDKYDDSEIQEKLNKLAEQKYDDADIREKLERLMEQKYDDSNVHEKLDRMAEHNTNAEQAFAQLSSLDQVQQSVAKTASDIAEFLSSQRQRIADDDEDKEKTLAETTIELERKLVEKDHAEAAVLSLRDEEERLRASVMDLKTEQQSLIRQKTRLTGDVSSLETAMRLRKEMLSDMEQRAESLERRIVEGVMDHSRVLLMSKSSKGGDAMSRKRVKKKTAGEETPVPRKTTPKPAVAMALASKVNFAVPSPGSARRIVSLSQMNNGGSPSAMKRSQSVRTPAASKALRKRSWGGDLGKNSFDGEADKENLSLRETVEEVDEPETPSAAVVLQNSMSRPEEDHSFVEEDTVLRSSLSGSSLGYDDQVSEADTLRRESRGTTIVTSSTDLYTSSEGGYTEDFDETGSEWTQSMVSGSELTASEVSEGGAGQGMVVYGS